MNKTTKILLGIWIVLAILSFIVSFWAPLFIMIVGLVFGSMNLLIIGALFSTFIEGLFQARKLKKLKEEQQNV